MFATLEAALWCVALGTWLVMLGAVVNDVAKKIVAGINRRPAGQDS